MSFRTERSVVKNLGYINVDVIEILRSVLNDKMYKLLWQIPICK